MLHMYLLIVQRRLLSSTVHCEPKVPFRRSAEVAHLMKPAGCRRKKKALVTKVSTQILFFFCVT